MGKHSRIKTSLTTKHHSTNSVKHRYRSAETLRIHMLVVLLMAIYTSSHLRATSMCQCAQQGEGVDAWAYEV